MSDSHCRGSRGQFGVPVSPQHEEAWDTGAAPCAEGAARPGCRWSRAPSLQLAGPNPSSSAHLDLEALAAAVERGAEEWVGGGERGGGEVGPAVLGNGAVAARALGAAGGNGGSGDAHGRRMCAECADCRGRVARQRGRPRAKIRGRARPARSPETPAVSRPPPWCRSWASWGPCRQGRRQRRLSGPAASR